MATHSSVLAWRIPGTGEPGGLPSMGSHRVGHDWSDLAISNFTLPTRSSQNSWWFNNRLSETGTKWLHLTAESRIWLILIRKFKKENLVLFNNNWSEVKVIQLCPTLATAWTLAHQTPLSMGFSRQEYWSGLPFPSPGDLPSPGIEPKFPSLQVLFKNNRN